MAKNVVVAYFNGSRNCITSYRYKWDYGQVLRFADLELPEFYEVHFSNVGDSASIGKIGNSAGVEIPDDLLKTGLPVLALVYINTGIEDGETVYRAMIPVVDRPSVPDYQPTDDQRNAIEQAIAALNDAVAQTHADVNTTDRNALLSFTNALLAESWAVGGTDSREGEDTDNAEYYSGLSDSSAQDAAASATEAESYAKGGTNSRTGEDTDNSKYYSEQSSGYADASSGYADNSAASAVLSESFTKGGTGTRTGENTDNANYYRGLAETAKTGAQTAQTAAETAQGKAETAQGKSETAQGKAEAAQTAAETAQGLAETAQGKAEAASQAIQDMSVAATGLPTGSSPTVSKSVDQQTGAVTLTYGIPKGDTGATPDITIGTVSTLPPGTPATASMTGTAENPVLSLGIPEGQPGDFTAQSIAPLFSTSSTYAVGDYVIYSGQLYRCTTAITTAAAWDASKWAAVGVITDLTAATQATAQLHLGFYLDSDGDLCQVD